MRIGNAFSINCSEYKSNVGKGKILSLNDKLDVIRQYLSHTINDHKTQGEWKIQLTMAINFISSKDSEEIRTMYTKSDNIEIIISNKTD